MVRFAVVFIAAALAWFSFAVPRFAAVGLTVGIAVAVVFLFIALSSGRGIVDARLRREPGKPTDPNSAISMGLGAAGIACATFANPHYPAAYRAFYAFCGIAGSLIAVTAAWRARQNDGKTFPPDHNSLH